MEEIHEKTPPPPESLQCELVTVEKYGVSLIGTLAQLCRNRKKMLTL